MTDPTPEPDNSTLREQLSAAAPGLGPIVLDALSAALQATKRVRLEEPCRKCGCAHTRYVDIPDATAAANAAKTLMEQVEGRPGVWGNGTPGETPMFVRRTNI